MKILVLGASGFIGKWVKQTLSEKHDVCGTSREPSSDDLCMLDLLDKVALKGVLTKIKPEIIINCAGVVGNNENASQNVTFTENILKSINELGLKPDKIIILGSAAEYGQVEPVDIPVNEKVQLNANKGYGLSKLEEEKIALKLAAKYNLRVIVARLFNPIGIGMHPRFLIPSLINQIKQIQQGKLEVIEISRLDSKRDYINVRDVAAALCLIVEGSPKEKIYNIGSGTSTSNGEVLELILKSSKLKISPKIVETSPNKEPLVAIQADITRLKTEFAWGPAYSMAQTVEEIINAS